MFSELHIMSVRSKNPSEFLFKLNFEVNIAYL